MTPQDEQAAIEAIRRAKARYWRGVDTCDGELVRAMLAPDCELDYRGCCADPASGRDFLPAMNVVLKGRGHWLADGMSRFGIVSVHQGHQSEVTFTSPTTASSIWAFTDRMFFPEGGDFARLTGYGHYHEGWERTSEGWLLKTLRITRLRVEVA